MGFKDYVQKTKTKYAVSKAREKLIIKEAKKASYEERKKQTVETARYKEKIKAENMRKAFKSSSKGSTGGGIGLMGVNAANYLLGTTPQKKKKSTENPFDKISRMI